MPQLGNGIEHFHKHILLKIRAREKRHAVRVHEYARWPTAVAGERLAGAHIDAVDVGALLAVDLDGDIIAVEQLGHVVVLKALVRHHVAPVARGVADGEEYGFILAPRLFKRRVTPRVPVDGVVRVLQKIRRFFVYQAVGDFTCHMAAPPWLGFS
ncbi:hypothetical protein SDC9_103031 [bioreactor metagenome]|uniref:Uncharacterized protein n=1 Tax=bioreactor metagenome TaxID=1076179 RepID=A0A645AT25_9ZZZZ